MEGIALRYHQTISYMEKSFYYLGKRYRPVREFTDKELDRLHEVLAFDRESTPEGYEYKSFYAASGGAEVDVFLCEDTMHEVVPCGRGLFKPPK